MSCCLRPKLPKDEEKAKALEQVQKEEKEGPLEQVQKEVKEEPQPLPAESKGHQDAFCGLQLTKVMPHKVVAVVDIRDADGRSPGEEGYANAKIDAGDTVVSLDGAIAQYIPNEVLHRLMQGPVGSTLSLELQRFDGTKYSVVLQRHTFHQYDQHAAEELGTVAKTGTDEEKEAVLQAAEVRVEWVEWRARKRLRTLRACARLPF
jgi:hypothetical protein